MASIVVCDSCAAFSHSVLVALSQAVVLRLRTLYYWRCLKRTMKRPASAQVMKRPAGTAEVMKRPAGTRGGTNTTLQKLWSEGKAKYEAALKAAMEKQEKGEEADLSYVSKFTLGVRLEEGWCPNAAYKLDKPKYVQAVSSCLNIHTEHIDARERGFLVTATYKFPKSDGFFDKIGTRHWIDAIDAVRRQHRGCLIVSSIQDKSTRASRLPRFTLSRDTGAFSIEIEVGETRHCLQRWEQREERVADLLEHLAHTTAIADALVYGGKCGRCPRRCGRSGFCCLKCRDSGGTAHETCCGTGLTDMFSSKSVDFEVAMELTLLARPQAFLLVETQAEVEAGVGEFSKDALAAIASGVGCGAVVPEGAIRTVPTLGQFSLEHNGSERVACVLCGSRPMMRWSWHDHASSAHHIGKQNAQGTTSAASKQGKLAESSLKPAALAEVAPHTAKQNAQPATSAASGRETPAASSMHSWKGHDMTVAELMDQYVPFHKY